MFQKIFACTLAVFEVCIVNVDLYVFIVMGYVYQVLIRFREVFLWNGNAHCNGPSTLMGNELYVR